MASGTELIQTYNRLVAEAANHRDRWERMAPFLAPSRIGITTQFVDGAKLSTGVYDSTMLMAAELMAQFIAGHIINPGQKWGGYTKRNIADQSIADPINEYLEECTDLTLKRAAASSYYAEAQECLIDYVGFGTGSIAGEEAPQPVNRTIRGFRGFVFQAKKTGRFVIQEGVDGLVDTQYDEEMMSARMIADRWPGEKLPENVSNAIRSGTAHRPFKIIHAVYPRRRAEQGYGNKGMPWASCWIENDSKEIISESGYRVFNKAVPRYQRTPGEVYGRGRGDIAFPDSWTLNTAKRMGLEDWALKIRPPIMHRHDSVFGTLRLVPAGPMSINTHGRPIRDTVMPFETGSHPEVSHIKEEELRTSIKQIFYVDQILKLLEVQKSEMTAFEFAKKIELLFKMLGPVYGRCEWELLYRQWELMWDIQTAAGAFPPPPPEMYQTDGLIDIEFHNPIAKAQRAGDAESVLMAVNDLAPLAQRYPEIFDRIDPQATADGVLDIRGFPAKWQRSDKAMAALQNERAAQTAKDSQMHDVTGMAEAAGKAAPALQLLTGGKAAGGR